MRFKKTAAAVMTVAALTLSLAACGDDDPTPTPAPAPAPAPTQPAPNPNPQPQPNPNPAPNPGQTAEEQAYLNTLYQNSSAFSQYNEADLIGVGYYICDSFDAGASVDSVVIDVFTNTGLSEYDTGIIIGSAVVNLCPTYLPDLQAWLDQAPQ